ncbi:hypothetical protein OG594_45955 [Streptomyces sp. NBC_01214]|uniref:hypothetical protein n=1 Tax=Streptomyces sp. NBC_01214 TaxID=2903777 RepID=UPI0022567540|nr:hypothetical protein [Streptomyces sp. NBC_01214]MCX4808811.1 hypothetical protein [Streptomyces sp. NBC_01214]
MLLGFFGLPTLVNSPTAMPPARPTVTVTVTAPAPSTAPSLPPSTARSSPASDEKPSGRDVVTTASFDLAEGYGFDLEDNPLRPSDRSELDFEFYTTSGSILRAQRGAKLVQLKRTETGSYETCSMVTRYTNALDPYSFSKGGQLCVISADGLIALVDITSANVGLGINPETLSMKVTVWAGQRT